jgi:hypothetical protein
MALRDTFAKLFEKPKAPPRKAWEAATATKEDQRIAAAELESQLREFNQRKADSFKEDLDKARQIVSLEHKRLDLRMEGRGQVRTGYQIEVQAQKLLESKTAQEREKIKDKPLQQLVDEAKTRTAERGDGENGQALGRQEPAEMKERSDPHLEPEPLINAYIAEVSEAEALFNQEAEHNAAPAEAAAAPRMTPEERAARIAASEAEAAKDPSNDLDPGREM